MVFDYIYESCKILFLIFILYNGYLLVGTNKKYNIKTKKNIDYLNELYDNNMLLIKNNKNLIKRLYQIQKQLNINENLNHLVFNKNDLKYDIKNFSRDYNIKNCNKILLVKNEKIILKMIYLNNQLNNNPTE